VRAGLVITTVSCALFGVASARAEPPTRRHVGEGLFSGWKTAHLVEGGLFGVEPRVVRTVAPRSAPVTDAGAALDLHLQIVMRSWYPDRLKTLRFSFDGALGADSSGFVGGIGHDAMGGLRFALPSAEEGEPSERLTRAPGYRQVDPELRRSLRSVFAASPHAVVARVGYHVHALGDQAFYDARLELPRAEIGYAYDGGGGRRSVALEVRAEAGLVLAGSFRVGDAGRKLGATVAWGARLLLHATDRMHGELQLSRLEDPQSTVGTPVDTVSALTCLRLAPGEGRQTVRGVCGVVRLESGELESSRGVGRASAGTAGVLVSLPWIAP
jgi:hypothetical protein